MSRSDQRTTIVAMMWFAIALIGIAMAAEMGSVLAVFGLIFIALISTLILMREPGQGIGFRDKRKRQSPADQVGLLMEILDEDERTEFKAMLKQRVLAQFDGAGEGELPADADSLAALLGTELGADGQHDRDRAASG